VWNEPNLAFRFWRCGAGCGAEPGRDARLLEAAAEAIAAAEPAAEVAFAGTVYLQIEPAGPDFAREALAAHPAAVRALDAMGMHAYSAYPPLAPPEAEGPYVTRLFHEVPLDDKVAAFRAALDDAGRADAPIWITEIGWPTGPFGVSEREQASYLVRASLIAAAAGASLVAWFNLGDGPAAGAFPPEDAFGIVRGDGSRKPAHAALATLTGALGDYRVEECAYGEVARCDLRGPRGRALALWRVEGGSSEPAAPWARRRIDLLGGEAAAEASVDVGPDPVYLLE
jgi:hypothetical protein